MSSFRGSSPLARGLPGRIRVQGQAPRIIPARAGFTTMSFDTDKPPIGSSPLARGLQPHLAGDQAGLRIIPARAGFTATSTPCLGSTGDHPRSRGVYTPARLSETVNSGSSPLARGLLSLRRRILGRGRIIPARAGFTWLRRGPPIGSPDHPRSRGVYALATLKESGVEGSSPLARGLRASIDLHEPEHRIIPARAGFTRGVASWPIEPSDHPRSRGVYPVGGRPHSRARGSSPLARGLRASASCGDDVAGIIPARAGFTRSFPRASSPVTDHPRSRGVYAYARSWTPPWAGSSPLARGLRGVAGVTWSPLGIIPARAGFT